MTRETRPRDLYSYRKAGEKMPGLPKGPRTPQPDMSEMEVPVQAMTRTVETHQYDIGVRKNGRRCPDCKRHHGRHSLTCSNFKPGGGYKAGGYLPQ